MKKFLAFAVALLSIFAVSGEPASAANKGLNGIWLIKYYPKAGTSTQQCIQFVQTNSIPGYRKYSGTWQAVANSNLYGQWVQQGDDIMWYGSNGNISFFSVGDMTTNRSIGGTGYAQFKTTNNSTQAAGNWTGEKVNRCAADK